MNETVVKGWGELQEILYEGSWNEDIGRYRSPYVFRGLSDKEYNLKTSLIRLMEKDEGDGPSSTEYENRESNLLRNFSKYAHREVSNQSVWHLLAVAQHHGLPTRLLDWTYSPLVAVHFATEESEKLDTDAVIWKVNHKKARRQLPRQLQRVLQEEKSNVFTVEMLEGAVSAIHEENQDNIEQTLESVSLTGRSYKVAPKKDNTVSFPSVRDSLEKFDQLGDFVAFFEPPSLDDRIVNQSALFSVASNPTMQLDSWVESHPEFCEKIIIPSELKPKFRDFLDQSNINERVLFPSLDGLADWLTRYYTPKHKWESYTEEN